MSKPGASRLREMLARNHEIALQTVEDAFPSDAFDLLQSWQSQRIATSFEELLSQQDCVEAGRFFLSELYGGHDFRKRDEDIGIVMPVMIRFLPDKVLHSMSEAFELQAISLEFDMAMAERMATVEMNSLDMGGYCEVYLAVGDHEGRGRQVELIRTLGYDLDKLVHKRFVSTLVRLLHGPAHAAGFGQLQDFLENGLNSFRALADAPRFIDTIYNSEKASMERMFDGDGDPFRLGDRAPYLKRQPK